MCVCNCVCVRVFLWLLLGLDVATLLFPFHLWSKCLCYLQINQVLLKIEFFCAVTHRILMQLYLNSELEFILENVHLTVVLSINAIHMLTSTNYVNTELAKLLYTVCQKITSHPWLAITLRHMNGF